MALLPYNMDYLTDELKKKAELELGETTDVVDKALKELYQCLAEDKRIHLPKDNSYFMLLLRVTKFKVKKAMDIIHAILESKEKFPDLLDRRDFDSIKTISQDKVMNILPYRDHNGCLIFWFRFPFVRLDEVSVEAYFHTAASVLFWCCYLFPPTQVCGFKGILDLKQMGVKHMRYVSARFLFFLISMFNKCIPARLGAIHIINEPLVIHYTWKIVKLTLSEKLRHRVFFHSKNLKGLHSDINPAILPKELGGSLEYDNGPWIKQLDQFEDTYYDLCRNYGYRHTIK